MIPVVIKVTTISGRARVMITAKAAIGLLWPEGKKGASISKPGIEKERLYPMQEGNEKVRA